MKHLYILNSIYSSVNFTYEIDSIISDSRVHEVTVLVCDHCVGKCCNNTFGNNIICKECRKRTNAVLKRIPGINVVYTSSFYNRNNNHPKHHYSSLKELNEIKYRGYEIGYGVSSYYISLTRNLYPIITTRLKRILDDWLNCSMSYTDIAEEVLSKGFDWVYIVNGRLFDSKPYQEVAFVKGLYVVLGESAISSKGNIVRMNFDNVRVHSITGNSDNIIKFWELSETPIEKRREIASSYYYKRANAIKTNDKIYTKNQTKGLLPNDWDENQTNIVIYNSSEDEFAAIGGEFVKDTLFENQIEGIIFILDNISDPSIHFYLRIHPNLMSIKYKYHTDLYKLPQKYNNITVIPGDSPISSYTLMKSCDRIISFGSTMGIESAYAGKSAMLLMPCFYQNLDVNYVPKTKDDVLSFIRGDVNFVPSHEGALKYSYYCFNEERNSINNAECTFKEIIISFMGKRIAVNSMNLNCSKFRMKICAILGLLSVFVAKTIIPKKEK